MTRKMMRLGKPTVVIVVSITAMLLCLCISCKGPERVEFSPVELEPYSTFRKYMETSGKFELGDVFTWIETLSARIAAVSPKNESCSENTVRQIIEDNPFTRPLTAKEAAYILPASSFVADHMDNKFSLDFLKSTFVVASAICWLKQHKFLNLDNKEFIDALTRIGVPVDEKQQSYAGALIFTICSERSKLTRKHKKKLAEYLDSIAWSSKAELPKYMMLYHLGRFLPEQSLVNVMKNDNCGIASRLYACFLLAKRTHRRKYILESARLIALTAESWPKDYDPFNLEYDLDMPISWLIDKSTMDVSLRHKPLRIIPWLVDNYAYLYWDSEVNRFTVSINHKRRAVPIDENARDILSGKQIKAVQKEVIEIEEISKLLADEEPGKGEKTKREK